MVDPRHPNRREADQGRAYLSTPPPPKSDLSGPARSGWGDQSQCLSMSVPDQRDSDYVSDSITGGGERIGGREGGVSREDYDRCKHNASHSHSHLSHIRTNPTPDPRHLGKKKNQPIWQGLRLQIQSRGTKSWSCNCDIGSLLF